MSQIIHIISICIVTLSILSFAVNVSSQNSIAGEDPASSNFWSRVRSFQLDQNAVYRVVSLQYSDEFSKFVYLYGVVSIKPSTSRLPTMASITTMDGSILVKNELMADRSRRNDILMQQKVCWYGSSQNYSQIFLKMQKSKDAPLVSGTAGVGIQRYQQIESIDIPQNLTGNIMATYSISTKSNGCFNTINASLVCPDTFFLDASGPEAVAEEKSIQVIDVIVSIRLLSGDRRDISSVSIDTAPHCGPNGLIQTNITTLSVSMKDDGVWEGTVNDLSRETLGGVWHVHLGASRRDVTYTLTINIVQNQVRIIPPSDGSFLTVVPVQWWIWVLVAALFVALGSWAMLWCFMKKERKHRRDELARMLTPVPEDTPELE